MIIDTNYDVSSRLQRFIDAGVNSFGRYIARGLEHEEKVVKPAEAHTIADVGCRLFLIYESTANEADRGAAAGKADGEYALAYAKTLGAPQGAAIYATVDHDAGASEILAIIDYFRAFNEALGGYYKLGAYASGYVCGALYARGIIAYRWLTMSSGFRGSREALASGQYDLRQLIDRDVAGIDVDPDETHEANGEFGDFVPFEEISYPLKADDDGVILPEVVPSTTKSEWHIPGLSWFANLLKM